MIMSADMTFTDRDKEILDAMIFHDSSFHNSLEKFEEKDYAMTAIPMVKRVNGKRVYLEQVLNMREALQVMRKLIRRSNRWEYECCKLRVQLNELKLPNPVTGTGEEPWHVGVETAIK